MEKIILKHRKEAIILFFLYILIFAIITIIALIFSTIQIEIKNIKLSASSNKLAIDPTYKISIKVYVLKKIKILDKQIKNDDFKNQDKFKKMQNKITVQMKNNGKNFQVEQIKILRNLKIEVKKMNFNVKIGTENAALTAIIVGMMYAIIPNIFNYFFDLEENTKFKIEPIYENKNLLNISFEGIFKLDLIHIINTYKVLIRKERKKNYDRTSNRRPYAYNNG